MNLNPTEPDRIVDTNLGRTDVGRILLQADLQLKKTTAALIHPKTELGRKFWNRIGGRCMSFRTWIVPGQARVNEQGDQLHILDAPLKVKMESQHLSGQGSEGAASCKDRSDPGSEGRNEKTFRDLILPGIERAVNHAAQYADLRRVHLSRVAAQWYRERDTRSPSTYGDLIDRGDVSRWETRTKWKPRDTFDAYVHAYKHGEFKVTERTRKGNYIYTRTYIYGGVDLSRLQLRKVPSADAFRDRWAGMQQDTARSARAARPAANGSQIWMGGDNSVTGKGSSATGGDKGPGQQPRRSGQRQGPELRPVRRGFVRCPRRPAGADAGGRRAVVRRGSGPQAGRTGTAGVRAGQVRRGEVRRERRAPAGTAPHRPVGFSGRPVASWW
ncbi:hypothetical protein ABWJ92_37195 [Streptomyces sp. NPDC000609]|uniref:hypothetical protein n=1 Tax=Streptomyces sp. NPDC000609 TaxID=3160957 RepID=UPI0033962021